MVGETSTATGLSVQARRTVSPWTVSASEDLQLDGQPDHITLNFHTVLMEIRPTY